MLSRGTVLFSSSSPLRVLPVQSGVNPIVHWGTNTNLPVAFSVLLWTVPHFIVKPLITHGWGVHPWSVTHYLKFYSGFCSGQKKAYRSRPRHAGYERPSASFRLSWCLDRQKTNSFTGLSTRTQQLSTHWTQANAVSSSLPIPSLVTVQVSKAETASDPYKQTKRLWAIELGKTHSGASYSRTSCWLSNVVVTLKQMHFLLVSGTFLLSFFM